jgi:hypothetical protein
LHLLQGAHFGLSLARKWFARNYASRSSETCITIFFERNVCCCQ